jgi:hypothetical protein
MLPPNRRIGWNLSPTHYKSEPNESTHLFTYFGPLNSTSRSATPSDRAAAQTPCAALHCLPIAGPTPASVAASDFAPLHTSGGSVTFSWSPERSASVVETRWKRTSHPCRTVLILERIADAAVAIARGMSCSTSISRAVRLSGTNVQPRGDMVAQIRPPLSIADDHALARPATRAGCGRTAARWFQS